MPYFFLIYSFVDVNLGCFNVLAIVNIAVMNIAAHVFFELSFPLGICSGVVLLGSMVVLFLGFKGTSIQLFIVTV